jgi:hypothetical protein
MAQPAQRLFVICGLLLGVASFGVCVQAPRLQPRAPAPGPAVAPVTSPAPVPVVATPQGTFLVKPYIQLGDAPALTSPERLDVLWHTSDVGAEWRVETRGMGDELWVSAATPAARRVAVAEIAPHRIYRTTITGLAPGEEFDYRVLKSGTPVFAARARARRAVNQPYRFVAFGDCGADTPEQRAVAYRTYVSRPDFVFITGDIVYSRGRISEYQTRYWPVYNADVASPVTGAPLIRSTLFLASPGNHDIANRDLGQYPDTLAYFMYWSQPLNGPLSAIGAANTPTLTGPEPNQQAFLKAAGKAYPRMANFSFDYGNAHWTVLDGNGYVNWTDPALRAWVAKDLAAAKDATWRFVGFHQPGFNSSRSHFNEQRMRLLADVFEEGRVDVVFAGHVHNYQRSFPMRFTVKPDTDGKPVRANGQVEGDWALDKAYDGRTRTRPDGVIYLVTGAGGARLYNPEQQEDPASWQSFTHKFVSQTHSITVADVTGNSIVFRQVAPEGKELDRFVVTK